MSLLYVCHIDVVSRILQVCTPQCAIVPTIMLTQAHIRTYVFGTINFFLLFLYK
jgi:hypothetical protein